MIRNQKVTGRAMSMPSGLALGALVSMVTTILVAFIGAELILQEVVSQDLVGYFSMAALVTATILGAVTAARKIKHQKAIICLISGGIYFCILLSITAVFFGGQYEGFLITLMTVALSSAAAIMIAAREGKNGGKRKHRKPK